MNFFLRVVDWLKRCVPEVLATNFFYSNSKYFTSNNLDSRVKNFSHHSMGNHPCTTDEQSDMDEWFEIGFKISKNHRKKGKKTQKSSE